jgi:uncharacterized membrane protein (DUF4010 family)
MDTFKKALTFTVFPQYPIAMSVITGVCILLIFIAIILVYYEHYLPAIILAFIGGTILYFKNNIFNFI